MNKCYFYRDPFDMAIMNKRYGMKFEKPDGDLIIDWEDVLEEIVNLYSSDWLPERGRLYEILPESYHILEQLPDKKREALKELGMWPQEEPLRDSNETTE